MADQTRIKTTSTSDDVREDTITVQVDEPANGQAVYCIPTEKWEEEVVGIYAHTATGSLKVLLSNNGTAVEFVGDDGSHKVTVNTTPATALPDGSAANRTIANGSSLILTISDVASSPTILVVQITVRRTKKNF